ncbi:toxin-like protein 14 [Parasteatoda tepidariorum]|uniref:toxin-like protein 14 n=1 Tax=Parasteatoda tepidariorum TaxID=114398 RepID=UPI00077F9598|nr:toxin-like protein 14 [Parasteatoda tepidariorum]XP_042903493.1 toxin-like protein 14 [Parasteatoda tepidariorum]
MTHSCCIFLLLGLSIFLPNVECYTYIEPLNTDNGYCEKEDFGKIPVGETRYNDEKCERGTCSSGSLDGAGCGVIFASPGCEVQQGSGHYPDCCPFLVCTK